MLLDGLCLCVFIGESRIIGISRNFIIRGCLDRLNWGRRVGMVICFGVSSCLAQRRDCSDLAVIVS